MRISIIGQPASGKSTLARAIAKRYSIPHIHLDELWFGEGGKQSGPKTPDVEGVRARMRAGVIAAIAQEAWVSDGVYSRVQPEIAKLADAIILIEVPLWQRLWNHVSRLTKPHARHAQLRFWHDLTFFFELIRRHFTSAPKIYGIVNSHKNKVTVLRSRKKIREYLETLK